jgi:hypothetical protein
MTARHSNRRNERATGLRTIRKHLPKHDIIGWYIAEAGIEFGSEPLTEKEERIVRAAIGRKVFREKECFHNAQRIVMADKTETLRYVEGYRLDDFAIHHAWATINGKVIDTTPSPPEGRVLDDRQLILMQCGIMPISGAAILGSFDSHALSYIGVSIPPRVFLPCRGGSALDDWKHGFPLIRAFERRAGKKYVRPPIPPHIQAKYDAIAKEKKRRGIAKK